MLLFGAQGATQGQTLTINFDNLTAAPAYPEGALIPTNARLSTQLLSLYGVSFRSQANYVAVVPLGANHATSGANGITGATSANTVDYGSASPVTISFFDPAHPSVKATTDFVSIRGDLLGGNPTLTTLKAFDIFGNLIGTNTQSDTGGQTYSRPLA